MAQARSGWRRMLVLGDANVLSRRWAMWVNVAAASPALSRSQRAWMYRRAGVLASSSSTVEPGCYFHSAEIDIGEGVLLNHGVHIENVARVAIGAGVAVGIQATILTSHHQIGTKEYRAGAWRCEPVVIGEGAWIGARATVLGGVVIGEGAVIAAGALVRGDCDPHTLYAGVPAKPVRRVDGDAEA